MKQDHKRLSEWMTFLLDLMSLMVSFYMAAFIRGGILKNWVFRDIYIDAFTVLVLSCVVINFISDSNRDIFKRGYMVELMCVIKYQAKLALILFAYMFAIQNSDLYSRIFLFLFFGINTLLTYVLRSYLKIAMLLGYKESELSNKVMLITVSRHAKSILRNMRRQYEWQSTVNSIAILDRDMVGEEIDGIEVIANRDNLYEVAKQNVVDEVFVNLPRTFELDMEKLILELERMGIKVHINLDIFGNIKVKEKTIDEFAGYQVVTFSSVLFDVRKAIIKRSMDILGGLIGCIITVFLTIILAPLIVIESRGPVFFSQIRVGKNGRRFKIYKFRSMYKDAEQRKAELMEKNEMKGQMFKISDDPRITKVGRFIRRTSLDEFPQFFNVLKGDMSLVGTRPPTEDEFLQYESRHKRRLSLKPGLTGMWQVSGRSDITDFEEVVKLDLEYIDNWSIGLDVKLIFKTIGVVILRKGSK